MKSWQLKTVQFMFGLGLLGLAVYGWHMLDMSGFLCFIIGCVGTGICCDVLGI